MERRSLPEEVLAQARERARSAGPLPDEVRAKLLALWSTQSGLQRPVARLTLANEAAAPSWWGITYAVPLLAEHLAGGLRAGRSDPGGQGARVLLDVAGLLRSADVEQGAAVLIAHAATRTGRSAAGKAVHLALRTLDLALVGCESAVALLAQAHGVVDLAVEAVANGLLDGDHAMHMASLAHGDGDRSEPGEPVGDLVLYRELLPPDDL